MQGGEEWYPQNGHTLAALTGAFAILVFEQQYAGVD